MLINNGAKINTWNIYGHSALDYASNATEGRFNSNCIAKFISLKLNTHGLFFLPLDREEVVRLLTQRGAEHGGRRKVQFLHR